MVSMQVRYEDVVDALHLDLEPAQLHLGSFATIDKKELVVKIDKLGTWVMPERRSCCSAAEYGNFESHGIKNRQECWRFYLEFFLMFA